MFESMPAFLGKGFDFEMWSIYFSMFFCARVIIGSQEE